MALLGDFVIEAGAGLIGVFAGVVLALWTERQRRDFEDRRKQEERAGELDGLRDLILSSVVRNTSEAKRLRGLLDSGSDPYLFRSTFELAIWDASQRQFVRLAALEERILFTRFFDQVRRLVRLMEFHRRVQADLRVRDEAEGQGHSSGDNVVSSRLAEVAEDLRLDGVVLISDHGKPLHKRLLGIQTEPNPSGN